jgi:hypothetical protein
MLGSNRSRGYCLEMICADFLAGANPDYGDPEMLLFSMTRFFKLGICGGLRALCPEKLWAKVRGEANSSSHTLARGGNGFSVCGSAVGACSFRSCYDSISAPCSSRVTRRTERNGTPR